MSQNFLFVQKMAGRAEAEGQNSNILTQYLSRLAGDRAEILEIDKCLEEKKILKKILPAWAMGLVADTNCRKGRHWQCFALKYGGMWISLS